LILYLAVDSPTRNNGDSLLSDTYSRLTSMERAVVHAEKSESSETATYVANTFRLV